MNCTSKKAFETYSKSYFKTYSKMASVLPTPSVLPQTFTTDYVQSAQPLVRSINGLRWWGAVIALEEHPDMTECEASHRHHEWTWRLTRTSEKGVYLQNTYYNDTLVLSDKMDTNFPGREEFLLSYFPSYKAKID